ncbi:MAG: uncharacterized protein K0S43_2359, partial [Cellulosimicrobium sp.]|nr:uncharacterized protein [Cellulosimicrobium sp.]
TLDLATAVVPPLAFASFELRGQPDPIAALEAVRSCTDRVDIFCQAGQIMVPTQHSDLMAYLEPMVHPVRRPRPGYLFHPKVWFLEYRADGEPDRFRLICSTRNLTPSSAWDAAVTLDGVRGDRPARRNTPIAAFIASLPTQSLQVLSERRQQRIAGLADAAAYVEWERPELVNNIEFHAFGVRGAKAAPDFSGYRHLVISPFVTDDGLAHVTRGARGNITLVSCRDALAALSRDTMADVEAFEIDPLAALHLPDDGDYVHSATDRSSPSVEVETRSGLHAKVTVVERERRAHVFIGSPNATGPAYGGNVEFAVELVGGATKLGVDAFLGDGQGLRSLLVTYDGAGGVGPDPAEEVLKALRNALRALAEIPFTLTVVPSTQNVVHDLRLTSEGSLPLPSGLALQAELLTVKGKVRVPEAASPVDVTFDGVTVPDITPFVILRVTDIESSTVSNPVELSTVIHAHLVGDPPNRLDEVLARQVDTPEKFLRFLMLLLGIGDAALMTLVEGEGDGAGQGEWQVGAGGTGIFETIVTALATKPASLRDLDRLVRRLQSTDAGAQVLPPGFDDLWTSVFDALERLEV